jgi:hypothetical protein
MFKACLFGTVTGVAVVLLAGCAAYPDVRTNADGTLIIASSVNPGHAKKAARAAKKRAERYCAAFGQHADFVDQAINEARTRSTLVFRCKWTSQAVQTSASCEKRTSTECVHVADDAT